MTSHICDGERVDRPFKGCKNPKHYSGTVSPLDYRHGKERRFSRDVHAYREARRNGLQPEQPSEASVHKEEWKQSQIESAKKKIEG